MSKKEDKVTLEDLYWATLSKNDIIRVLKDTCIKNMVLEKQLEIKDQRIAELEEQLKNAIVPKFKKDEFVYAVFSQNDIFKGQIDVFDYYNQSYLVFFGEDIGGEWFYESYIFKTKKEALAKLEELKGENK